MKHRFGSYSALCTHTRTHIYTLPLLLGFCNRYAHLSLTHFTLLAFFQYGNSGGPLVNLVSEKNAEKHVFLFSWQNYCVFIVSNTVKILWRSHWLDVLGASTLPDGLCQHLETFIVSSVLWMFWISSKLDVHWLRFDTFWLFLYTVLIHTSAYNDIKDYNSRCSIISSHCTACVK